MYCDVNLGSIVKYAHTSISKFIFDKHRSAVELYAWNAAFSNENMHKDVFHFSLW